MNSIVRNTIVLVSLLAVLPAFGFEYQGTVFCDRNTRDSVALSADQEKVQREVFYEIREEARNGGQVTKIPGELFKGITPSDTLKIRESLCKGTAPLRTVRVTLEQYDPKFEPGISIDTVAELKNAYLTSARKAARSFLGISSRLPTQENCTQDLVGPFQGGYGSGGMFGKHLAQGSQGRYWLELVNRSGDTALEAVTKFKYSVELAQSAKQNPGPIQFLAVSEKGQTRLLAVPEVYFRKVYKEMFGEDVIFFPPVQGKFVGSYFHSTAEVQKVRYQNASDLETYRITPVQAACYGEVCQLREAFMFSDVPDDVQKNSFKLKKPLGRDEKSKHWSITAALRDSDQIWEAYLENFTTVKEAQDPEAHKTKYELELDLGPFCRYAMPKKDMVAQ